MQSHAQKLNKAAVSGNHTFEFPQEAQKFSATTVIDALQCFKKGNRRYSLEDKCNTLKSKHARHAE
eukprot:863073-Pelagomonas_calceolata.AAC.1